ncbi:ParB/RepB/Spo0J family partition protein [Anaerotruncus rubiinfantis]|uniref:ParB/RepB/Spo0J family partition protein n=1 Tax=Anaerotruncus rubiinfantis TaxID=1720200 RepID=UPI003D7BFC00
MIERKLKKIDSLFVSPGQSPHEEYSEKRQLTVIDHSLIDPHPKHRFKPYNEQAHPGLLESIRALGVLQPILLQAKPDGRYTLLAGYKRLYCNTKAGHREILALVDHKIPDAAAELIVTQTNTTQYGLSDFLPSELAYALKMELDAFTELRRQLKSKGETTGEIQVGDKVFQMAHLEKSRDSLAKAYGITATNVQRYIQLTSLIPPLLELVDQKKIALRAAVPLSTLPEELQTAVLSCINDGCTITTEKALLLKKEQEAGSLTPENVHTLLSQSVPAAKPKSISLRSSVIKKYFADGLSEEEIQSTIEEALKLYFERKGS